MEFKFNYWEKRLWKTDGEYSSEISKDNRYIEHFFMRGTRITFKFGESHWLILNPDDEFNLKMTACYTKPDQNGEMTYYEKKITRSWWQVEITFEFTEADKQENPSTFK